MPPRLLGAADDMTDDEWLRTYCREIRDRLAAAGNNLTAFDMSAVLYKETRKAIGLIKSKTDAAAKSAVKSGVPNVPILPPFERLTRLKHPRDWLVCGKCKGAGTYYPGEAAEDPIVCDACRGSGFDLSWERADWGRGWLATRIGRVFGGQGEGCSTTKANRPWSGQLQGRFAIHLCRLPPSRPASSRG